MSNSFFRVPTSNPLDNIALEKLADQAYMTEKNRFLETESVSAIMERIQAYLSDPAHELSTLSAAERQFILVELRNRITQDLQAIIAKRQRPSARQEQAFSHFKLSDATPESLDALPIDEVICRFFNYQVDIYENLLRTKIEDQLILEKKKANTLTLQKMLSGGPQASNEPVCIATSHEQIMTLELVAAAAGFNIKEYISVDGKIDADENNNKKIFLTFETYPKLNFALNAHFENFFQESAKLQQMLTDWKKRQNQCQEAISFFSKTQHETKAVIIRNIAA